VVGELLGAPASGGSGGRAPGLGAPRVDTESTRAAAEAQASDDDQLLAEDDRTLFTARLAGRPAIAPGQEIELAVDTKRLYFFDPGSGDTLAAAGDPARAPA
jgi:multiple sugar transport system ATP-binding protein